MRLLPLVAAALAVGAPLAVLAQGARTPQAERGAALYAEHCAVCHGENGRGGGGYASPIWGAGSDIGKFGTAQGLFEYLQLLMPFDDPTKLDDEQKWAIAAYMLMNHGALPATRILAPEGAAAVAIR